MRLVDHFIVGGPGGAPAHPRRRASPAEVAATVHAVLDELDRLP